MAAPMTDAEDDKPLDPAVEAVRRRLARLMVVSIGIMMIGLLAVLGAIVYKMQGASGDSGDRTISIPQGASIVDQSIGEGHLVLRIRMADGTEKLLFHRLEDGAKTGEWLVAPAP
jgi:hypothetical protein